jgi:hypothetical protein
VDHGDGTSAIYMHLRHNGVRVQVGRHVNTGRLLAYSGNTGWSGGPHTHFMVMQSSAGDWYAQSLPVAFADVPANAGVPANGMRLPSGNAGIDPALILPPCDLGDQAGVNGFKPFWVESFRPPRPGPAATARQSCSGRWGTGIVFAPERSLLLGMDKRREWLAALTTRELVIFLMELRRMWLQEPKLAAEVNAACAELRKELLRREWPAPMRL